MKAKEGQMSFKNAKINGEQWSIAWWQFQITPRSKCKMLK